jgi:hypothetical protein
VSTTRQRTVVWLVIAGGIASLVMAGVIAYYASPHPDGLESVAEQEGFAETAEDSALAGSPLADYGVTGIDNDRTSAGLAGLAGVAVTAALGFGLFLALRARRGDSGTQTQLAADRPTAHG